MSNILKISRLEIKDLDKNEIRRGVYVSDDYASCLFDYMVDKNGKEVILPEDDQELLNLIFLNSEQFTEILEDLLDFSEDVVNFVKIGDNRYNYKEYRKMVKKAKSLKG